MHFLTVLKSSTWVWVVRQKPLLAGGAALLIFGQLLAAVMLYSGLGSLASQLQLGQLPALADAFMLVAAFAFQTLSPKCVSVLGIYWGEAYSVKVRQRAFEAVSRRRASAQQKLAANISEMAFSDDSRQYVGAIITWLSVRAGGVSSLIVVAMWSPAAAAAIY